MFKTTIKNLLGHKLRVVITAIAIIAGVSFMAGTFVLTDTITSAFNSLFANTTKGVDAVVRQQASFKLSAVGGGGGGGVQGGAQRDQISDSLLSQILKVPGVASAEGTLFVTNGAIPIGTDGKPINPQVGAPAFAANWQTVTSMSPYTLDSGKAPVGENQIVIDKLTATRGKLAVGDTVRLAVLKGTIRTVKVVGVITVDGQDSLGGATIVLMDTSSATKLFGQPGKVDNIIVHAAGGVSQSALVHRLDAALPASYQSITGSAYAKENEDQIQKGISVLTTVLGVFAGISLVAGAFLIYNIFGIVVAQRTKELALLRAIGATRKQVSRSVLIEAFVTGALASLLGLLAGIGLALGITQLLKAIGLDVSASSLVVKPRTVIVALVVGVVVTVASAYLPARRASRVSPMAAIRDVAVDDSGRSSVRLVVGVLFAIVGIALVTLGSASQTAIVIGGGGLALFVAVVVLGPVLAPPLVRLIGSLLPVVKGVTGRLARDNAIRSPRRTAATATSLILALTLVSIITIFFSSFTASINAAVSKGFKGDFQLSAGSTGAGTLSPELADKLAQLPQLRAVAPLSVGAASLAGKGLLIWGTDGPGLKQTLDIGVDSGNLANLVGTDTIAMDSDTAKTSDRQIGSLIPLGFPNGQSRTFRVVATYTQGGIIGQGADAKFLLPTAAFQAYEPVQVNVDLRVLVKRAPGVSQAAARAAVKQAAQDYPTTTIQDVKQIQKSQTKAISGFLNIILVLLALSVFIGFLGIAITLALSVIERTRELGLLRAIGMDRKRMKSMVRWEAVLIALLGTGIGLVLGVSIGAALASTFSTQIDTARISFPITRLVLYAVFASMFGVLAAIYPARRAAKLDVLQAISSE